MSPKRLYQTIHTTVNPSGRSPADHQQGISLYLTCAFAMVAILAVDLKIPLGVAMAVLYSAVVLLSLRSEEKRFILFVAIVSSLFTIGPLLHKEPIDEMWKAVVNRLLALTSIWVTCYLGMQRRALEKKREKALVEREKAFQEVRVLRGFLPICASCKKIRSLEGSWTLLEKYISEHSEAEFSHGLCPECTRKLFPQFFDEGPDHTPRPPGEGKG
ncbi:hypothetical protein [Geomonas sp.]|uniref:hypothetical protein n=1 Tax=Geomonas sp. TaxID=2651584 RepID=UPI002B491330|nr:hypothetical protein [Geomonas sp.]HJV35050.1 hypothetical protein [Geomonas sp.]